MSNAVFIAAENRGLLAIAGPDRQPFLQGLISNDATKVDGARALYATFLTPQGRYLHDFFLAAIGETLYLDLEAARRDDLKRRLSLYKLRSQVTIGDASADFAVILIYGEGALAKLELEARCGAARPLEGGVVFTDPRLAALGARAILPRAQAQAIMAKIGLTPGDPAGYEALRLRLGVPDGSRDLPIEKAILLENGMDELHAIDWDKGCYLGQELTARTRYRGLVRKRLMPVRIEGAVPPPGTALAFAGEEAGEMRSASAGYGLALIRLEIFEKAAGRPLEAPGAALYPQKPDWANF